MFVIFRNYLGILLTTIQHVAATVIILLLNINI